MVRQKPVLKTTCLVSISCLRETHLTPWEGSPSWLGLAELLMALELSQHSLGLSNLSGEALWRLAHLDLHRFGQGGSVLGRVLLAW